MTNLTSRLEPWANVSYVQPEEDMDMSTERPTPDRELLKLAAKAAGVEIDYSTTNGGGQHNTGFNIFGDAVLDWHNGTTWNPLTDDGDALRLAVKLGLNIYIYPKDRFMMCESDEGIFYDDSKFGGACDPYAAIRRSIVRAAAKIGSAL